MQMKLSWLYLWSCSGTGIKSRQLPGEGDFGQLLRQSANRAESFVPKKQGESLVSSPFWTLRSVMYGTTSAKREGIIQPGETTEFSA